MGGILTMLKLGLKTLTIGLRIINYNNGAELK